MFQTKATTLYQKIYLSPWKPFFFSKLKTMKPVPFEKVPYDEQYESRDFVRLKK
tara:strand:+ start:310 stop:471 length:162 start_codon:yes stop_codon:yes gene_type:complete